MVDAQTRNLKNAIETVQEQEYHKLVLLVGGFASGKTRLMRRARDEFGGAYLNVNLELTGELLTIDARKYVTKASRLVKQLCETDGTDRPLFVDNIELLFSPEVGRLNPIDLFKKVSRRRVVVLSLPCRLGGRARAEYSEPGRQDHMHLDISGFTVIELEGEI